MSDLPEGVRRRASMHIDELGTGKFKIVTDGCDNPGPAAVLVLVGSRAVATFTELFPLLADLVGFERPETISYDGDDDE